jgi:hypothetical protein
MKKLISLLLLSLSPMALAKNYVVEMKAELNQQQLNEFKKLQGIHHIEKFAPSDDDYFKRLYIVDVSKSSQDQLEDLKRHPVVLNVEQSFETSFFEIKPNKASEMKTNDMLFPLQWGLYNQEQIISKQKLRGGAPEETVGVRGIDIGWHDSIQQIEANMKKAPVVAVIDTGIDIDHPELKDAILKNDLECDKDGNLPFDRSQDKDGNGYPADCYGFNFAATDPSFIQLPLDDKNHGTHVAGIIAAKSNNKIGVSGVSDKIKILPIKVTGFVDETRERNNLILRAPSERIARGILYAVARNVDVINLSLGWPKSMDTEYMRRAILLALSRNITIVAAAGNNNTNGNIYPCAYEGVICVGSVNADGKMSEFSNYGGEVDILAPGDQILSTIPTSFAPIKMNIQGYDIISGTSQAAPFVAATAALLKATNPLISAEEVRGRLFTGAKDKVGNDKSLFGILNIKKTFEVRPSVVVPAFKSRISYHREQVGANVVERFRISERSEILFNKHNGRFTFALFLQSLGIVESHMRYKVQINFDSPDIRLDANTYMLNAQDLQRALAINGTIMNKYMDNMVKYNVVIETLNHDNSSTHFAEYTHEVSIAKMSVALDQNQKIIGGHEIQIDQRLAERDDIKGNLHRFLRTVDEVVVKSNMPTYYLRHQPSNPKNDAEDGIRLYFFQFENNNLVQSPYEYFSPKASTLLEITKGDFNYDGEADYLIKTIIQEKEGKGYILYSYRDLNLQPLLGNYSDIRYYPEIVNVTPKTVRFVKTKLPNGQYIATPYFVNNGRLPDLDQVKDPWIAKDQSERRRIYYLEIVEGEIPTYQARSFYNGDFIRRVRSELGSFDDQTVANNDTNVEIVQLLNQNAGQYYQGEVEALASYGLGFYRTNLKVTINHESFKLSAVEKITERLLGHDHHEVVDLAKNQVERTNQNAFVGFLTSDILSVTTVFQDQQKKFVYRNRDANDKVLSFISLFQADQKQSMFLETIDYLLLVTEENGKQSIAKRKTKKFSFLPGNMMSELYYPIVMHGSDNSMKPAIYVDATQLSNNHVYVNTLIDGKLVAPVDYSLAVPSYCMAKNPYATARGEHRYVLMCFQNNEYKIIFEELVAP